MAITFSSDAELVAFHEGLLLTAKPDAKGCWVIGRGRDIPAPADPSNPPTCTQEEADAWFVADMALARQRAATALGQAWDDLDEVRRAVLTDMAFEIGGAGLTLFKIMLNAIKGYRYVAAAQAGLQSEWARQVPARAKMDMDMMASGEWPVV